jgi:hypothetical protein
MRRDIGVREQQRDVVSDPAQRFDGVAGAWGATGVEQDA